MKWHVENSKYEIADEKNLHPRPKPQKINTNCYSKSIMVFMIYILIKCKGSEVYAIGKLRAKLFTFHNFLRKQTEQGATNRLRSQKWKTDLASTFWPAADGKTGNAIRVLG